MHNDIRLTISAAGSRKAALWPRQTLLWSELLTRIQTPAQGVEDQVAYLRLPKARQDELKDVGGFVGGTLRGDRRKAGNVESRCLVTLDYDNLPAMGADDFMRRLDGLGCAWAVYSTRKHRPDAPRLRALIPLARPATADEYEPVARKLAELIGIAGCDPTTFEPSRLMYWPSVCAGAEYIFNYADKPFAHVDGLLGLYADWRDMGGWPQVPGIREKETRLAAKQEDPEAKRGIVGAFCRCYDVPQAMAEFLPGVYEDAGEGRYTYAEGSTTGGAVLYEHGKWLYSHHATDPAGGKLVNAFDLVRLHKYAALDDEIAPGVPGNRLPSFKAMTGFAGELDAVRLLIRREHLLRVAEDFGDEDGEVTVEDGDEWLLKLESGIGGQLAKTMENGLTILRYDPRLRGLLAYDRFAERLMATGAMPWDGREERREWTDTDDHGLAHYLEQAHHLDLPERKMVAVTDLYAKEHAYDDVGAYLMGLDWDGEPRLDTLLVDYMGAEDTPYTRAVTRKALTAAVARVMTPGVKFDWVLTLVGGQGVGKSTLLRTLGRDWFCDSITSFEGKDVCEQLRGKWIIELGELSALSRTELNLCKQFLSRQDDTYRAAYGRRSETHPRRCVFFGTTNEQEFLRDTTGDRRWWPVEVMTNTPRRSVFTDLGVAVDQIWAEAVYRWRMGEQLHLDAELEAAAREKQAAHREGDAWEGLIRGYLDRELPANWPETELYARRMYLQGEGGGAVNEGAGRGPRRTVCAMEIWCECLGMDKARMRQQESRRINGIMERIEGWTRKDGIYTGLYGRQRGFQRW